MEKSVTTTPAIIGVEEEEEELVSETVLDSIMIGVEVVLVTFVIDAVVDVEVIAVEVVARQRRRFPLMKAGSQSHLPLPLRTLLSRHEPGQGSAGVGVRVHLTHNGTMRLRSMCRLERSTQHWDHMRRSMQMLQRMTCQMPPSS